MPDQIGTDWGWEKNPIFLKKAIVRYAWKVNARGTLDIEAQNVQRFLHKSEGT